MNGKLRAILATMAFALCIHWSSRAKADVTITGIVGEIGMVGTAPSSCPVVPIIRFKFTDPNQTKTCSGVVCSSSNGSGSVGAGYAFFRPDGSAGIAEQMYREIYAALLVSKRGATISCTVDSTTNCHITSCTLP